MPEPKQALDELNYLVGTAGIWMGRCLYYFEGICFACFKVPSDILNNMSYHRDTYIGPGRGLQPLPNGGATVVLM